MNKLTDLEIGEDGITFYFDESDEPWGVVEFTRGTITRNLLEKIEDAIYELNRHLENKS